MKLGAQSLVIKRLMISSPKQNTELENTIPELTSRKKIAHLDILIKTIIRKQRIMSMILIREEQKKRKQKVKY